MSETRKQRQQKIKRMRDVALRHEPSCVLLRTPESSLNKRRSGFAIAPILYLLTLTGVAAGVLFSSYSQILRTNVAITNVTAAKNDLQASITTLAATSKVGALDTQVLCPPGSSTTTGLGQECEGTPEKMVLFANVAAGDLVRLPANYALADDAGAPLEVGVPAAGSGVKPLDPWGRFYVYCRWENTRASPDSPAISMISAGANGTLETTCGDTQAKGDDQLTAVTVGTAIQRASVWQASTGSGSDTTVEYGDPLSKVKIHNDGTIEAVNLLLSGTATFGTGYFSSLSLGTPLPVSSGGTGADTQHGARVGLGAGTVGENIYVSITTDAAQTAIGATDMGKYLLSSSTLVAATATDVRNTLLGAGAAGGSVFVAATATDGRTALGASATMGHYLFASSTFDAAKAPLVRTTLLGSGSIGDSLFVESDQTNALITLGATATFARDVFRAANTTTARTALGGGVTGSLLFTATSQINAWEILGLTGTSGTLLDVDITGNAVNVTGVVGIDHGGTGATTATTALNNLFNGDGGPGSGTLKVARIAANSLDSSKLTNVITAGNYNTVTVDSAGRVIGGSLNSTETDHITDGIGDSIVASATGLVFSTGSAVRMTLTSAGYLGLNITNPAERLHVNVGNVRVSNAAGSSRELQFVTSTNDKRWVVAADATAESGGSAGSDFKINRYTDSSNTATNVLTINRATGNATFAGQVAATGGFLGVFTGTFVGTIGTNIDLGASAANTNPRRSGEAGTGLFSNVTNTVAIATNSAERLRVTATGSVGIGTSTPGYKLDVAGDINLNAITNALYVAGTKVFHQPASDTTSIAIGPGVLNSQTATNRYNVGVGNGVLGLNSTGFQNTAIGTSVLASNTSGTLNTGVGIDVLKNTSTGYQNTAMGVSALYSNTNGYQNVAIGIDALRANTSGIQNVAIGIGSLYSNTNGGANVALGPDALRLNTTGWNNTAVGYAALRSTATFSGGNNTALGLNAGYALISGNSNLILGYEVGKTTLTTGSSNILIGTNSAVTTPAAGTSSYLNIGNTVFGDLTTGRVLLQGGATVSSNTPRVGSVLDMGYATGANYSSLILPQDTTANRPATPVVGMIRYNTTTSALESYQGASATWTSFLTSSSTMGSGIILGANATNTNPSRNGDVTTGLFSDTATTVSIATGGTERLRVTATGSVGLGTNDPPYRLDIKHTSGNANTRIYSTVQNADLILDAATGYNGRVFFRTSGTSNFTMGTDGADSNKFKIGTTDISTSTRLTIDSSGNIGIGTATPSEALNVNGNVLLTSTGRFMSSGGTSYHQEIQSTSWGQGAEWGINATYSGANDPLGTGNFTYKVDPGTYNTGAGLLRFDGNAKTWKIAAAGTSSGAGGAVTWTQLSNMSLSSAWISPRGTSSDFNLDASGHVAIGTTSPTAGTVLDITGTGTGYSSIIIPRDTTANRPATPAVGMIRYNTTLSSLEAYQGASPTWTSFLTSSSTMGSGIILGANAANTNPSRNGDVTTGLFSDTATTVSIATGGTERLRVTATGGVGIGTAAPGERLHVVGDVQIDGAGGTIGGTTIANGFLKIGTTLGIDSNEIYYAGTDGYLGTVGNYALRFQTNGALRMFVSGGGNIGINTATPSQKLDVNGNINVTAITDGYYLANSKILGQPASDTTSLAVGTSALAAQTATNLWNTAVGYGALTINTGAGNSGFGAQALRFNTTGTNNTAVGLNALYNNTTGVSNTAVGEEALGASSTGSRNTGMGHGALVLNLASDNTAVGYTALYYNTTGGGNTAVGTGAMLGDTANRLTGNYNTALGGNSLMGIRTTAANNTALGFNSGATMTTGSSNVIIGYNVASTTLTTGSSNILIGNSAAVTTPAAATSNYLNIGGVIKWDMSSGTALVQPAQDTTSIAAGPGALAAQAGTNKKNTAFGVQALTLSTAEQNTAYGYFALNGNTTGAYNTAIGHSVLAQTTTGIANTGVGFRSLEANSSGSWNVAVGANALLNNSTGGNNTALGSWALTANTTGTENTALGYNTLISNTTGGGNTAVGSAALQSTTTGVSNTANGYAALIYNTTGGGNTAMGQGALYYNTTGGGNTAIGINSMVGNTAARLTGTQNTAIGGESLTSIQTTASYNVALGYLALSNLTAANSNVAIGQNAGSAITTGGGNVILGPGVASTTLTTGSSNILIGTSNAVTTPAAATSNWLNIGNLIYGNMSTARIGIGSATINAGASLDLSSRTDSLLLPTGTTGQRPGTPAVGMIRYNSTLSSLEAYQGASATWTTLSGSATAGSTMYLGANATNTSPSRNGDVTTGLFSDTATTVSIATGGTERLRVTATGSVGIATTAPLEMLDVSGNVYVRGRNIYTAHDGATNANNDFIAYNDTGVLGSGGVFSLHADVARTATWDSPTAALSAKGGYFSGSVGIGTASPAEQLEVQGNLKVGNDNVISTGFLMQRSLGGMRTTSHRFVSSNNSPWYVFGENLTWSAERAGTVEPTVAYRPYYEAFAPGAGYKEFGFVNVSSGAFTGTNLIPNLVLKNDGNVGIGTTSPSYKLDVSGDVNLAELTATTGYYIGGARVLGRPGLDTTSIAVGGGAALSQTATNLNNTAVGVSALVLNQTGYQNTVVGAQSLFKTTTGSIGNTAVGYQTLYNTTTGGRNTALGNTALYYNTTGGFNTAVGNQSLSYNTTGSDNTAVGSYSVLYTTTATGNTGVGAWALYSDFTNRLTGPHNTGVGASALRNIQTTANSNTAIGQNAGSAIITGASNTILGQGVASTTLTTGSSNILIGNSNAVTTPAAGTSNWLNIGNTIYGDMSTKRIGIGSATINAGASLDLSSQTDSLLLPAGTTAQRPGTPAVGMIRYNSTLSSLEAYQGASATWTTLSGSATAGSTMYLGTSTANASPSRNGDATTGLFSGTASTVSIATAGAERLRVTATGSVGVGTTIPGGLFQASDNAGAGIQLGSRLTSVPNQVPALLAWGESTLGQAGDLIVAPRTDISTASIRFYTNNGTTTGERLRVTATGSVGIGTTSPSYKLQVTGGTVSIDGSANPYLRLNDGTVTSYLQLASGKLDINAYTANTDIQLSTIGTGVVYVPTANVGIGITPAYGLHVGNANALGVTAGYGKVNAMANHAVISAGGGSPNAASLSFGDNTGWRFHVGTNLAGVFTPRVTFYDSGNVGIGTTSPISKLDVSGNINVSAATDAYYLGGYKILSRPVGDTTSVAVGLSALAGQTATLIYNTAVGYSALGNITTGTQNTAVGAQALLFNGAGSYNSAFGVNALYYNTTGTGNTALGTGALSNTTTGSYNTASGYAALVYNAGGSGNVAMGYTALYHNLTGSSNVALGTAAMVGIAANKLTGSSNTAVGNESLYSLQGGAISNSAFGANTGTAVTTGVANTIVGTSAMPALTTGGYNVALGYNAGSSITTGSYNVVLGPGVANSVLTTGSSNILIGNDGTVTTPAAATSNYLNIGNVIKWNMTTGAAITQPANDTTSLAIGPGTLAAQTTTLKYNIAVGTNALAATTNGVQNAAFGTNALYSNQTGVLNAAFGYLALNANTTGNTNTGFGGDVLFYNTTGTNNVGVGYLANGSVTTGSSNVAIGAAALYNNTGTLGNAGTFTGLGNVVIGSYVASTTLPTGNGSYNILIGNTSAVDTPTSSTSNYLNIGNVIKWNMASGTAITQPANDTTSIAIGPGTLAAQSVTNLGNTAVGYLALWNTTTGGANTAVGYGTLAGNTAGNSNTAMGYTALTANNTGTFNTAVGHSALAANTTGASNTAMGYTALSGNATGTFNTAMGSGALNVTAGHYNTGIGASSLTYNLSGSYNVSVGYQANLYATTGNKNTAVGATSILGSFANRLTGENNTAVGYAALRVIQGAASNNTAIGEGAGYSLTTGSANTLVGVRSGFFITTGSDNILIGDNVSSPSASTSYFLNIGNVINVDMSGQKMGIYKGTTVASYPLQVGTDSTNGNGAYLTAAGAWTPISDRRVKENIREIPYGLDALMKLKPVAYEMVITHEKQVGLIAQDVEKVVPEVVSVSKEGRYGLSYDNLLAVAIKAVQEMKVANDNQAAKLAVLSQENQKMRDELALIRSKATAVALPVSPDDTRDLLLLAIRVGGALGTVLLLGLLGCGIALYKQRKKAA